ncbi:MAG: DNA polymerase Y family protein [Opitutaceae bacterium]|nr:DNA polymerase Y family protein [Opitutaceae bacterium]
MNYAVLWVRDFSLNALRRGDPALAGKAVALIEGDGRRARVVELSPEVTGVTPGLTAPLAMARCPGILLRQRDPVAESEANRLLLAAAFTLSPRVEFTGPGWVSVDLQGAQAGRTEAQMRCCAAELAVAGLPACIGAAATPHLASCAARCADPVLVVRDGVEFLRPLPLAFAEPTPGQAVVLQGWGIRTLGELTALPKAEIGQRLGTDGVLLWERAAGETTRPLRLTQPAKSFVAEWTYEPPIEAMEPLLFRLRRFAECVALELRAEGLVAEKLTLTLLLEDATDYRRELRLPEPGADVDGWMRVFQAHLETVRTAGRVVGARLAATPCRPARKQGGLFDTGLRDPAAFWENLARVAALVGEGRVGTPVVRDTHRPDAVVLEKPAETVPLPAQPSVHASRGLVLRRFRPPWPARVQLADMRPFRLESRLVCGEVRAVQGPWRSSGEWWKPEGWAVETWQVELAEGGLYQLACTAEGWCVEGELD